MKKLSILLSALMIFGATCAKAANIGDVIGDIYSTDIIADVDGAPIRSFSLNGKTAIILEDLRRYGFQVGYNDSLRAIYAGVLTNTYNAEPDTVERGRCGEIVGHIYYSDITASINGVDVPGFSLNGETAVAIEDIGGDITQTDRSDTGMMYKWNSENRTITLLPERDNIVKAAIVFNQYSAAPYIENGVLKYERGLCQSEILADIPAGAYKYPIRFGSSDGEIVGYAYDSGENEPVQYEDGTWEMTNKRRVITHFDIEMLSRLAADENISPMNFEDVIARETELLTENGAKPEEYTTEGGIILRQGGKITIVSKSETGMGTALRRSDFPAIQMTREQPSAEDYEFASAEPVYGADGAVYSYMFTYKTGNGRIYQIQACTGVAGYFQYAEAVPRTTELGTMYSVAAIPPDGGTGCALGQIKLTVDENTRTVPALLSYSYIYNPWVPAKDIAEMLGGTAKMSADGFTVELTSDGQTHNVGYTLMTSETMPEKLANTLYSDFSDTAWSASMHGKISIDGREISKQVTRELSTAGMSTRTVTVNLDTKIYDGTVFINIEPIQNLYKQGEN